MAHAVRLFTGMILGLFRTRRELLLENLVLRQQLMVLRKETSKMNDRRFPGAFEISKDFFESKSR